MKFENPALSVEFLSVILGGREILKPSSMSFDIQSGEIAALLGPNGSGKSTLIRAIRGLINKNSGTIKYRGKDTSPLKPKETAKIFAHVAQNERFSAAYTVLESVVMGRYPYLRNFERYSENDYGRARDAIQRVSLSGFEHRSVTELSGGEGARVMIARALAQDTPILLLDEPTAAQDPRHSLEIMKVLRGLAKEGKVILTAIHDINLAIESADRLIFLKNGEIMADRFSLDVDENILEQVYSIPWQILRSEKLDRRFAIPV
jgi:iron complex transport system ATP-binding protein